MYTTAPPNSRVTQKIRHSNNKKGVLKGCYFISFFFCFVLFCSFIARILLLNNIGFILYPPHFLLSCDFENHNILFSDFKK